MKTRFLILAVLLVCAPIQAAVDAFLALDGVPGESVDAQFPNQIEIESWSWGVTGAPVVVGGGGTGKATFQDIHFSKHIDKSSPVLMLACASGRHYPTATISVRKAGGDKPQVYLKITLSDVLVSSYSIGGSSASAEAPTEQISFTYGKIKVEYTPQSTDGSLGQPVIFSWDLVANKAS